MAEEERTAREDCDDHQARSGWSLVFPRESVYFMFHCLSQHHFLYQEQPVYSDFFSTSGKKDKKYRAWRVAYRDANNLLHYLHEYRETDEKECKLLLW